MPFNFQDLGKALGSDAGQFGLNTLMGMFANKGQQDAANKANQQSLMQGIMGDRLSRDMAYMNQAKTGWQQNYLQHNLAKNIAFQRLLGGSQIMPTNQGVIDKLNAIGWKPFTPTLSEDWQALDPFGAKMATEMLGNRERDLSMLAQGRNQQTDWTRLLGMNPQTQSMNAINQAYTGGVRQDANQFMQNMLQQQQQQQQKNSGFWGKLGGALKFAAPIAASFIPGVGPLAAAAIGGLGSAAGSKMQGNSWGNAIASGIMGGAGAYGMDKLNAGGFWKPKVPTPGAGGGFQLPTNLMNPLSMFGGGGSPLQSAIDGKLPQSKPYTYQGSGYMAQFPSTGRYGYNQ